MGNKVLVIEDNEQNRYLMHFLLEAKGFSVIEAEDGIEGIRLAKNEQPDLILLDIQLPGMDGYEIAGILSITPDTAEIPIVAVTSYAMPGDRERIIKAGATGYIEKPINPTTFTDQIMTYITAREAGRS
jgi:CheY-like chemotaxis protein